MYACLVFVLQLHFVFSGALPFEKRDTTNAGGTDVKWSDVVDANSTCKTTGVFPRLDGCNTCTCEAGRLVACTLKFCPPEPTGKINPGGKCKPGQTWTLDECNSCVCTHTGYASCTLYDCPSPPKRPKRTPADTGKINPDRKCKPGDRWDTDECNKCVCTHTGYASCTANDCYSDQRRPKRAPAESGKINPGGKCKPGEKWKLDECNNCVCTHTGYASCTVNDCSSQKRPKRTPAESGKINPGGKCKPGERWKLDECNNCVCTHTGYASCTVNDCSSQKRPKRSPAESGKISPAGKCKPGDKWKLDECNNCVCTHTGYASCTLNDCSSSQKRPKRTPAESGKISPAGKCKPGEKWKLDECNSCVCTHTGYASCTLNDCSSAQKRPKRTPAESGKTNSGGKCKPGDRWKLDECNSCVCTHTGYASCTLNDCSSSQKRPKRTPAETGKINPGGKCKPGDKWKLDECNRCVCTPNGRASCTSNDCSSKQKRPKRSPAENGKIPPGGKCKPGNHWKLDECNKCVCTHTGYASCTLNDCSSQKGRGKRSSDGSRSVFSEYVNEEGKCKKPGSFPLDCNSCSCAKVGEPYYCTLQGCPKSSYKLERITRDARGENGNSGLECKPGVSWKENCNSCFCSERGIAMCTDIPECPSPPPAPAKVESTSARVVSTTTSVSSDLSTSISNQTSTESTEVVSSSTGVETPSQELLPSLKPSENETSVENSSVVPLLTTSSTTTELVPTKSQKE